MTDLPSGFRLLAEALVETAFDVIQQLAIQENIGLGNVDNTSDISKPVSTAQAAAISAAISAAITALTKASVGLGNVDNTSDANKPVSTAQAAADALKVAKAGDTMTGLLTLSGAPTTGLHAATKTYVDTADGLKLDKTGGTLTGALTLAADPTVALHASTKQYVDNMVNALLDAANAEQFKGLLDCSANPNYPAANAGWVYKVSVAGRIGGASGTIVEIGDRLQCIVDGSAAGTEAAVGANWWITQANVGFSSNGISLVTAANYAAMKTLLAIAAADITDTSANGRSLITAASYAAMKTLLAIAAADITDASANGRSLITAANYAAMKTALAISVSDLTDGASKANVTALRYYLHGLILSVAGGTGTFGVGIGTAADSTNANLMDLAAAYTKTTAAWAVGSGNGALDTGAIATNTWYHVFLIKRIDTGIVDLLISTSFSAPTLPTNYTLKRYIGSMLTDGSSQWVKFVQDGDWFIWDVPVVEVNAAVLASNNAILQALTLPPGLSVIAKYHARVYSSAASYTATLFSDPAITDTTPDIVNAQQIGNTSLSPFAQLFTRTDTSRQIRYRTTQGSAGTCNVVIVTEGYINTRGKS